MSELDGPFGVGGVRDKSIFWENAGDEHIGQCASCLDQSTKEFAVSPAYFDYSMLGVKDNILMKQMVQDFIDSRLGYTKGAVKKGSTESYYNVLCCCLLPLQTSEG